MAALVISSSLLVPQFGRANSAINIGPLADVDELSIEKVMIGDTLASDHNRASPLFGADRKRAEAFTTALMSRVAEQLKAAGLRLVQNPDISTVTIGFNVFGGKFESGTDDAQNFFLLEVWVYQPSGEKTCPERTILGVVDDKNLSSTLIEAAAKAVDELLDNRKIVRASRASTRADREDLPKALPPIPSGEVKVEFDEFAPPCSLAEDSAVPALRGVPSFDYPEVARKARMEGTVALRVRILTSGAVDSVEVSKGLNPLLDASAIRGIRAVAFQPASCRRQAVEASLTALVRYVLH